MAQVPVYFELFDRLRDIADVILLDQRGTGRSIPAIDCGSAEPLPTDVFAGETRARTEIVRRAARCASRLRAQAIELSAYNSEEIAADLEDLRRALGAERLNLLAVSYGTEIALQAARRRSGTLNRIVLAGTRGPDQLMRLPSVLDTQVRKLAYLERQQGQQPLDLAQVLTQLMERLRQHPLSLTITDRRAKKPLDVTVGAVALQVLLLGEVSDGRAVAGVPGWLRALHAGDDRPFARRVEQLYHGLASPPLFGMAVNCAAGWSAEREAHALREGRDAILGGIANFLLRRDACRAVGVPALGGDFLAPITSSVKALFLSGTLDAQTPPMQAEQVRFGFPNSHHVIVENGSHEVLPIEDVQRVVVDFLKGDDVSGRTVTQAPPRFAPLAAGQLQ